MQIKNKIQFFAIVLLLGTFSCKVDKKPDIPPKLKYIFDMVHNNPGEEPTISIYNDPEFVKSRGYNGMVPQWYINCAVTYDNFEDGIVPFGSEERQWIEARAAMIDEKLKACDAAGMNVYAFTDIFVAPKTVCLTLSPIWF